MRPLIMLFRRDIRKLEYDPATQYRFHFTATWTWLTSMPLTAAIFWPHSLAQLAQLLILEISLWANVATHFGAMSAALAAKQTGQIPTDSPVKNPTLEQYHYSAPIARENGREIAPEAELLAEFDA